VVAIAMAIAITIAIAIAIAMVIFHVLKFKRIYVGRPYVRMFISKCREKNTRICDNGNVWDSGTWALQ
jgi:hypothetical protein